MGLPLRSSAQTDFRFKAPLAAVAPADRSPKLANKFKQLGKFRPVYPASLAKSALPLQERASGEMAEWLKPHAWTACVRETVPWVRIPLSPPAKSGAPYLLGPR